MERFERIQKRLDLAQLAALAGFCAVQDTKFGFLFRNCFFGYDILQIQLPFARELVAKFVSLRKVISRLQKENRDSGHTFAQQMENDHVLGLKTAGEAHLRFRVSTQYRIDYFLGGVRMEEVKFSG
jgi:hypothetical protein